MNKFLRIAERRKGEVVQLDERVRSALVESLFGSPSTLIIGAVCGMLTGIYLAWASGNATVAKAAAVLSLVAIIRIWTTCVFARQIRRGRGHQHIYWERLYEIGAWSYSFTLGVLCGATVLHSHDAMLHTLAVANAVGYAGGISSRNAGRPIIAIGQFLLVTVPVTVALLMVASITYLILAATIMMFIGAMIGITQKTYEVVRRSFSMAQEKSDLADRMEILALTDDLTGFINRYGLNVHVENIFANRGDQPVALLWLDIDRFKEVNDSLGHPIGDQLLIRVADKIRAVLGDAGAAARFGGDEFIIICPDMSIAEAEDMAQRLLEVVRMPTRIDGHIINVSGSIGVAVAPFHGTEPDIIMRNADIALYGSKAAGRDRSSLFDFSMNRALIRRKELEVELRAAIELNELELHYQPIVEVETRSIVAFEALIRWNHPTRGPLRPSEFIAIAEETGLIITLGNWIAAEACRTASQWPEHIGVCVNISPVQMQAPGASLGILNALQASGLAPHRLELEITETALLDTNPQVKDFVAAIDEVGIKMALDDFGTGYSSLSYLHQYNFSKIKVDSSFVSGALAGKKSDAIIKAVAELANTLDMNIVAEGIETEEQAASVLAVGCRQGQGYLFGAAMPSAKVDALLALGGRIAQAA